ncbi:unnamed protein product, partial [Adineta steineri]
IVPPVVICEPRQVPGLSADILWSFDCENANNDRSNTSQYNGIGINSPGYVNHDYSGQNAALWLDHYKKQYINISQPIDYTMKSLAISAWIRLFLKPGLQYGTILSQCGISNNTANCLRCEVRKDGGLNNMIMYFELNGKTVIGSSPIAISQWQHVAFVFNNKTMRQSIYLNGRLDNEIEATGLVSQMDFQTTPIIGTHDRSFENFYSGIIDQLTFSFRAKSAGEILDEATLLVHYQFNSSAQVYNDSGPNGILGKGSNVSFDASSSSLLLDTYSSYYRSSNLLLGSNVTSYSYSFSMWLTILSKISIGMRIPLVRLSVVTPTTGTETCLAILRIDATDFVLTQYPRPSSSVIFTYNNTIKENNPFHVAVTYNDSNTTLSLYINGNVVGSSNVSSVSSLVNTENHVILTIGHTNDSPSFLDLCNVYLGYDVLYHYISFIGMVDDVRLYSRVLTADEIKTFVSIRR